MNEDFVERRKVGRPRKDTIDDRHVIQLRVSEDMLQRIIKVKKTYDPITRSEFVRKILTSKLNDMEKSK